MSGGHIFITTLERFLCRYFSPGLEAIERYLKIKNEIAVHSGSEMQNKMEAKEESIMLDNVMPKEERPLISNSVMKIKSEIANCRDSEAEDKIKIKQEVLILDIGLQNEDSAYSDTMRTKNNIDAYRILSKIEIKEEPWWQEKTSPEMKCQPEASCVSDLHMCCEVKDEADEDFTAAESTRLPTETTSSAYDVTPCIFTTSDLKGKEGEKDNLGFAGAKYIHGTYGSNVMEASCIGETIQYDKLKSTHELTQNEKLNECSKKLHVCEICKKCFSQQNAFKAHILFHEGKRRYKCYICEKSYTRSGHLKAHSLIHEGKRPYKCSVCGKTYTRSGHLKTHSFIHEGKRPYKCDACEKGFTKMEDLKRHILIHEGKKPYKCEVCDKSFTQSGHLKTHRLIHMGKRPYKCEVCEKSYTRSGHLKTHSLIHEGKRPYNCDVCKKGFSKMRYLERHSLVHEGEGHTR